MSPPIHFIPTETLANIFICVLDAENQLLPMRRALLPPALLLRSVCQRWHAVAEDTSALWPDLVGPYGLEWTRRALLWSKNCSLDIYLCNNEHLSRRITDWDASIPLVLAEMHRAQKLVIECDHWDSARIVRQALLPYLPRLVELYIDGKYAGAPDETSFAGETPDRLKYLTLNSCTISPMCPMFRAPLTSLKLNGCLIWTSMDEFMHALSRLPHLEIFEWAVYFWTDEETVATLPLAASTESNPHMVHLPCLQSIKISAQIEVITYLFTHVTLPASCSAVIDADTNQIGTEEMQELLSSLDSAFAKLLRAAFPDDDPNTGYGSLTIDTFQAEIPEGVSFAWSRPTTRTAPPHFHLAFLPPHDHDGHAHPDLLLIACHILNNWPAAHRALVQLRNEHPTFFHTEPDSIYPEDQPWAQILRPLRSVEYLETHHTIHGLADALAIRHPNIILPRLQHVTIRDTGVSSADIGDLASALKTHRQTDSGVILPHPTLRIKDCYLDGMAFKAFIG
ncbi:hypothetical protein PENSPDRAFT_754920 [Peniophora sp. CONT]|nr:hypothetical protein PENSPDRAFT_754920 [Peniophora sp. CONT]